MADRIVVGYFGDRGLLAQTVPASAARGLDVVAVAFDLGRTTPLSALRDDPLPAAPDGVVGLRVSDGRVDVISRLVAS